MPCSTLGTMILISGLLSTSLGAQADAIYRYSDSGTVSYGDSLPPAANDDNHAVLNYQGVVVDNVLDREDRLRAEEEARKNEREALRDRTLLATFTSEQDLLETRDDRLSMVDGQINRLDETIKLMQERLSEVDQRIAEQSGTDRSVAESLNSEKSSLQIRLDSSWSLMYARANSRLKIVSKFENDLARYRELKAQR